MLKQEPTRYALNVRKDGGSIYMVAPVIGPIRLTTDQLTWYLRRETYKQSRPYNLELPYTRVSGARVKATGNTTGDSPSNVAEQTMSMISSSALLNGARIRAYDKFKDSLSSRASMAENVAQVNQSVSTIAARCTQLLHFTNAVRRGRLGDAARILRTPEPKVRHPIKESGNQWLEYHLGIAPLVQDVYNAIDILQNPLKNHKLRVRVTAGEGVTLSRTTSSQPWAVGLREEKLEWLKVQYEAEVAVSNPNLYLANTLGVVNPAVFAWQMIPLSFVLDWFVNVEQFLGTATDLFGLTIQRSSTAFMYRSSYYELWNTYGWELKFELFGMNRGPGITVPGLGLRPARALSWQRGLTAVALLVPALKSLDYVPKPGQPPRKLTKRPKYDWADEPTRRGA